MMDVLVTCPPMLGLLDEFNELAQKMGLKLYPAKTKQVLSEDELVTLLPNYDGWIIGDDPATSRVLEKGKSGRLKAAVKWGVGIDNVDFEACERLSIPVANTPDMFGAEVADLAICYILGLSRQAFFIDGEIKNNFSWPKPAGVSISGKTIGIVGFGDIGFQTAKRLAGFDVNLIVYDPAVDGGKGLSHVEREPWPNRLHDVDFLVFTCSLNKKNFHMLDKDSIGLMKFGSYVINVARGQLIDEEALILFLQNGRLAGAALDVFETEPLPKSSPLRAIPQCVFGSHNGSNTVEAVRRASIEALNRLARLIYAND